MIVWYNIIAIILLLKYTLYNIALFKFQLGRCQSLEHSLLAEAAVCVYACRGGSSCSEHIQSQ